MDTYQFSFEKLEVWQESRKLTGNIYQLTSNFPVEEKYGIIQQMRRAAISVCSNIAEGTTRVSPKDQAHFTVIAYSSLMELLNQLIIATDMNFLESQKLEDLRKMIQPLSIKLSNLKKSQLSRIGKLRSLWLMLVSPYLFQSLQNINP